MPLPWILVFWPWLGAALLCALPPRGPLAPLLNVGVSAVSLALALALLGQPMGEQGWTRTDALNLPFVALSAFIGFTTAVFSAGTFAAERLEGLRRRAFFLVFQVFCGAQALALLSDNLGVMWIAIEIATLACALMVGVHGTPAAVEAAWKLFILCGVGIALALFGTIVLYLAAQPVTGAGDPGLSWAALRAVAARCDPGVLSLAFVFLLVGYGTKAGLAPLHSWLPDAEAEGPLPISAVLSGLLLNAALLAIVRGAAIVSANGGAMPTGPLLAGLGLLSLLLAAFSLWRRRDARRLFAWSSIEHMGLAAIAFGIGAPLAGLLQMAGHALVKSAVFFAVGAAAELRGGRSLDALGGLVASHPVLGWSLALGIAGLAGMPPFLPFAAEVLLVAGTAVQAPALLPLLGLGLFVAAAALVAALQRLCLGPPAPDAPAEAQAAFRLPGGLAWASLPICAHLLLAAWLGLAMPAPLAALFAEAAVVAGIR